MGFKTQAKFMLTTLLKFNVKQAFCYQIMVNSRLILF